MWGGFARSSWQDPGGRPSLTVEGSEQPARHHSVVMHCSRCLKKSRRYLATWLSSLDPG